MARTIQRTGLGAPLLALGGVLLALTLVGAVAQWHTDHFMLYVVTIVQAPVYAVAVWLILKRADASILNSGRALVAILLAGMAMRLLLLPGQPISTDVWRYIWDGRVQGAGINPYLHIPSDDALAFLRDDTIYPQMNRTEYAPTIYAPTAQLVFFLVTRLSDSVIAMKTAMLLFEAGIVWAILRLLAARGLPRTHVLLYVWHPLPVWEFAGSGHVDAIAISFLLLALIAADSRRPWLAGAALAAGTFIKYLPVAAAPALYKKWGWRFPLAFGAVAVALYLPYLGAGAKVTGFLGGYFAEEGMVSGAGVYLWTLFDSLVHVPGGALVFYPMAAAGLMALAFVLFLRRNERGADIAMAFVLALATTVLVSPHWPWYFVWLIPFLCFYPTWSVIYLTGACSFLNFVGSPPSFWEQSVLYIPFFLILAAEQVRIRAANKESRDGHAFLA